MACEMKSPSHPTGVYSQKVLKRRQEPGLNKKDCSIRRDPDKEIIP